jgi:hypothetical protein
VNAVAAAEEPVRNDRREREGLFSMVTNTSTNAAIV